MRSPSGIEIKPGQIWKENDNRYKREIEIIDKNEETGKVTIKSISPLPERCTIASLKRFNGKHGGYSFTGKYNY